MSDDKTTGALMLERMKAEHQATEDAWEEAERDREKRCAQLESVCRAFGNHNEWSNCHDLGEEAVALALECAEEIRHLRVRVAELEATIADTLTRQADQARWSREVEEMQRSLADGHKRSAHQRGAESMRERAAAHVDAEGDRLEARAESHPPGTIDEERAIVCYRLADEIRALPLAAKLDEVTR